MNFGRWLRIGVVIAGHILLVELSAQVSPQVSAAVPLTDEEAAWVKAHPVVRWGLDPRWPPFSYKDHQGQWTGIDVEITRRVARNAGLNVVIVPTSSWRQTLKRAGAGEIDFLSATARTRERLADFDYSDSYGSFPVVIVTRHQTGFVASIHNLASARIAAVKDHVTFEQLRKDFPDLKLVLTESSEDALLMVSTGQADAAIENLAVTGYLFNLRGFVNLKISGVTRYEFPLHFAVQKDAPLLTSILNKGLATIEPQEREVVYAKYVHPEIGKARDWGMWRRRAIYAGLAGAAITLLFLIWNRTMARQLERCKTVEAALREAKEKLEHHTRELDARVQDVERLNQELTIANKDLDAFTASVSHDLRAPLRRMNGFASLLQKQGLDPASPKVQEYWSILNREARRMNQLIDDLLGFARIGRVTMHRETVDMSQLVRETVKEFALESEGRQIEWHIGPLPEVIGDRNLLRQVFANLVGNALKFSRGRPRAEIKIDVLPVQPDAKEVVFFVQDNGCGFDMRHAQSLFGAFQRLHLETEYEGTGIGLVNVQRIIQRHGGRVWADGAVDQGATFWFSLPRTPASRH